MPSKREVLSFSSSNALLDPGFYLVGQPGDAALPELNPGRKSAGTFQSPDVNEAVGDAIDRFQFALRYELEGHHNVPSKRSVATPG
jgi:hypothetical protein